MKYTKIVICIALITALAMCFAACSKETPVTENISEAPVTATVSLAEVLTPQRSQLLSSGETLQLAIPKDREVTITSSNEKVATVNGSGLVTAVGKGMAIITVSAGEDQAVCGVIVDGMGSLIDVTKLTRNEIFTDLQLHSGTEIMGMAMDAKNQTLYIAQGYGSSSYVPLNSDFVISKVEKKGDAWELGSWMRFSGSGKGKIALDEDDRLWMESNGDYIGYGRAISLVEWEDNGYGLEEYGQVFTPKGVNSMTVAADTQNNMVLIYDRNEKCYRVYDREAMLAGEEAPDYVHSFACKANQTPVAGVDDSQGRYNASVHGYALYDGYLYQFSGSSSIYLSVFDLNGNLQYCHRLQDLPEVEYYMPASVSVSEGKIYVVIATGNSAYNLANLLVFE